MKTKFRIFLLTLFIGLVGHIFYLSPQIILKQLDWPSSIKLSLALCGMIIGILYFSKEKLPPGETLKKASHPSQRNDDEKENPVDQSGQDRSSEKLKREDEVSTNLD